jgi:hypothetical protein
MPQNPWLAQPAQQGIPAQAALPAEQAQPTLAADAVQPVQHAQAAQQFQHDPLNWISLDLIAGVSVVNIRYERDINDFFSIGGVFRFNYWQDTITSDGYWEGWQSSFLRIGALLALRAYPTTFPFYLELGAGGDMVSRNNGGDSEGRLEFEIAPAMGVRLGGPGGFFVSPFVSLPIRFFEDWNGVGRTAINVRAGAGIGWTW